MLRIFIAMGLVWIYCCWIGNEPRKPFLVSFFFQMETPPSPIYYAICAYLTCICVCIHIYIYENIHINAHNILQHNILQHVAATTTRKTSTTSRATAPATIATATAPLTTMGRTTCVTPQTTGRNKYQLVHQQ